MDIVNILSQVPNLVIAIWVIYTLQKQNALLQDRLTQLIDKLMDMHPPQSEASAKDIADDRLSK